MSRCGKYFKKNFKFDKISCLKFYLWVRAKNAKRLQRVDLPTYGRWITETASLFKNVLSSHSNEYISLYRKIRILIKNCPCFAMFRVFSMFVIFWYIISLYTWTLLSILPFCPGHIKPTCPPLSWKWSYL